MFSIKDLIKELEVQTNKFSYVFFDEESGKINKISSRLNSSEESKFIEVPTFEVENLLNGKRKTEDFHVTYDLSTKRLALKEITYENKLDSVEYRLYELPTFRTTTNEFGDRRSIAFEEIYDGVEVYVWVKDFSYPESSLVWYKNNVWKLKQDFKKNNNFDESKADIFIKDVVLTDVKSLNQTIDEIVSYEEIYQGIHVDVWYDEVEHFAGQHVWFNGNVYRLKNGTKKQNKKAINGDPQYQGIHVDVWYDELEHLPGQHVWHNNSVYKILGKQAANTQFNVKNTELVVSNVKLYDDENKSLNFDLLVKEGDLILDNNQIFLARNNSYDEDAARPIIETIPQYRGVHVDVWYDELEHLPGQHVWYNKNVYKIVDKQEANTSFNLENAVKVIDNVKLYDDDNKSLVFDQSISSGELVLDKNKIYQVVSVYFNKTTFDYDNAELVLSKVKLFDDTNKDLEFDKEIDFGDNILDNNKLYLYSKKQIKRDIDTNTINFYASAQDLIVYNESSETFVNLYLSTKSLDSKIEANVTSVNIDSMVIKVEEIKKGQKALIGKKLYLANPLDDHSYDINVVQNNKIGCWEVYLNKRTKDFLLKSKFSPSDVLYFSITARHDPNILYRSLRFSLNDLLKDKAYRYMFQYDWEFNREDVSIYTPKYFDTYAHEILE